MNLASSGFVTAQSSSAPFFLNGDFFGSPVESTLNDAKQTILQTYIDKFNINQGLKGSGKEITPNFFKQWESEGKIATLLEKELDNQLKQIGVAISGGGFSARVRTHLNNMSASELKWDTHTVESVLKEIQITLLNYLNILAEAKEWYGYDQILKLYRDAGGILDGAAIPSTINRIEGTEYSMVSLTQGDQKFNSLINDLSKIITNINAGGTNDDKTPEQVIRSITSSFNAIGGEFIFEPLAVLCANNIKKAVKDKVIDNIEDAFKANGGIVKSEWIPSNVFNSQGKQIKPDISIIWSDGNLTLELGGSVKLRQSQTVLKAGNTFSGKLKPQESFTLGQMLALVSNEQAVRQFEKGWSAILVSSEGKHDDYVNASNLTSYTEAWNTAKEYGKYAAAFRVLVGEGTKKDFAAILIINNKVYSTYGILNRLENKTKYTIKNDAVAITGNGFTSSYATHSKNYKTKWQNNGSPKYLQNQRQHEFMDLVKTIYAKKINITINFANFAMV